MSDELERELQLQSLHRFETEEVPTLRDRFAMAALQGELAAQSIETGEYPSTKENLDLLGRRCFLIADAMMEARD